MANSIKGLCYDSVDLHYNKFKNAQKLDTLDLMKAGALKRLNGYNLVSIEHNSAQLAIEQAYERRKGEITNGDVERCVTVQVRHLQSKGLTPEEQLAEALRSIA